ncbi:putative helicase MOV-10 isoform X2 [Aedes aegypti]|uniref:Uncharacterized protein n=1 Tax=Aedes aegypti TaxID=7159 RepID=A0A6I8TQW8_AEDAE|nr:putative helicase MOV-10 isoform X2 [Aedes aegypti]
MDNDSGGSGFWHHNTAPWENNEPSSPVSDSSSGKWFPKTVQSVELLIETEKSSTDEDVTPMQTNNNDESPDLPILPADCIMTSKIDSPPACREKIRSDQIVPKSPDIEHIQTRMFNQQTANEGRAEKNRNNRSLAYAKARAELKKKPPKKCRTRNGKTNKPKKAHLKKYDKVDIVLDVKRITTLIRFVSEQNQSSSECELRRTCPLCTTSILESAIREHFVNCHGAKFSLEPLLTADIRNHVISREVLQVKLKQDPHRNGSYFLLTVTNIAAVTILLKSIYVFDGIGTLSPIFSAEGVLRMKPGFFYEDELQLQVSDECVQSLLVTVNPIDELRATYDVVEQYHIKKVCTKCTRIAGTPLKLANLPHYRIPTSIRTLHENNYKLQNAAYGPAEYDVLRRLNEAKNPSSLNRDNYAKQLNMLNRIEVEHLRCEYNSYSIERPKLQRIKKVKKRKDGPHDVQILYVLSMNQFENRPMLISEDQIVEVDVMNDDKLTQYTGTVECVEPSGILFLLDDTLPIENVIRIRFSPNNSTFQLEQQALDRLAECQKEKILFPTRGDSAQRDTMDEITSFQWINIGISTNEEQMVAVRNIVNRTSFPAPYVLFGPPGTGKSSTLVEVIGQIYKLHPEANMLVVAPSNFAANEITSRILNVVPEKHVFRYFSRSSIRTVNDIDENILQISNMADKKYDLPYYQDIYLARIVVTTLATAGRLVQANIRAKHFRYVIVDECGSAKEISSLVPIGGLATCGDEIHASIVLAGDPKQLGPVIQHNYLKQTNHNVSLLERIMKLDLYEMNRTTKEYNNRYITQLRDNFRSHSMLLNFPNKTFYAGQLRAKASPELTNWALGWHRLPNPKCPLIFHSIFGNMQQHENSTSLFNVVEGELVLCYLTDILHHGINGRQVRQCDIGLISPYASQILHLRTLCIARGWEDIEIGSAEQYQGREKAIIIMSTVRSRSKHLGFLTNAKRLNVTITRARALMIIIGDGYTLQNDANWKALVNYCRQQKAFVYGKSLLSSATPNLAHVKDDLIVLTDKSDETPANTVASKITPKAEINPKPNREIPGKDKKQWQARRISTRVRT